MTNLTQKQVTVQLSLFEIVTIHCFFGRCKHVVQSINPNEAHKLMEQHYIKSHAARIAAITENRVTR